MRSEGMGEETEEDVVTRLPTHREGRDGDSKDIGVDDGDCRRVEE